MSALTRRDCNASNITRSRAYERREGDIYLMRATLNLHLDSGNYRLWDGSVSRRVGYCAPCIFHKSQKSILAIDTLWVELSLSYMCCQSYGEDELWHCYAMTSDLD